MLEPTFTHWEGHGPWGWSSSFGFSVGASNWEDWKCEMRGKGLVNKLTGMPWHKALHDGGYFTPLFWCEVEDYVWKVRTSTFAFLTNSRNNGASPKTCYTTPPCYDSNIFWSCLIMLFKFREEFLTAEATDEVSLDGGEVIKGGWVEDVFVAGGCRYSIQLLQVCVGHSHRQDADSWKNTHESTREVKTMTYGRFKKTYVLTKSTCNSGRRNHIILGPAIRDEDQDMGGIWPHPQRFLEKFFQNIADSLSCKNNEIFLKKGNIEWWDDVFVFW